MKVLVTGGGGFIGRHLVIRLLARGDTVRCMFHSTRQKALIDQLKQLGAEIIFGDLASLRDWRDVLDGIERVYHVAAATRARSRAEYYKSNLDGTLNLAKACITLGTQIDRFLFVSSLAAVGPSRNGTLMDESAPYHPVSEYGKSKMLAEQRLLDLADRLPVTIVRPSAVYGPGERDLYSYFQLMKYHLLPLIGFNGKRVNLVYSDDVVNGIITAASSPSTIGKAYFLADGRDYKSSEVGKQIGSVMGIRPFTIRLPHSLAFLIGAVSEVMGKIMRRPIFFNIQKAREVVQDSWTCSIRNAKKDFGFSPNVDLREGLRRTYEWYKSEGWL